jgi:hypothetical protein
MCLTLVAYKTHGEFEDYGIYGNFCGWKNAARDKNGNPIDWKNKIEAFEAMLNLKALDEIDDTCKRHDLEYLVDKISVCKADHAFIKKLTEIALNPTNDLMAEKREMALVLAETIRKNGFTCHIFNLF